ncbi:MAG: GntR family transcriptional regulator, partial [Bryobacteraceae bacterium]
MAKRIYTSAPSPIGSQLRTILIDELQCGRFVPGGKIPSERDLAQRYRISRASVRDSIARLINEGILVRAGVRGTFVAERIPTFAGTSPGTRNIAFLAYRNVL